MAKQKSHPETGMAQSFSDVLPHESARQNVLKLILVLLLVLLVGCMASSPRFTSQDSHSQKSDAGEKNGYFSRANEWEEEVKEDDKKVDVKTVRVRILSSSEEDPAIDKVRVMDEVLSLIGTPYSDDIDNSLGMDCSGFTGRIYSKVFGKSLPHTSRHQDDVGISVLHNHLRFGDLVFFNTTGEVPSHVGIYLGDGLFAHASVSAGITISSLESSYYKKRYVGARRIVDNR